MRYVFFDKSVTGQDIHFSIDLNDMHVNYILKRFKSEENLTGGFK